jgi:hypothetical protein
MVPRAPLFAPGKGKRQKATGLPLRWSEQQLYEKGDPFTYASLSPFHGLAVAKIAAPQSSEAIVGFLLSHQTDANATSSQHTAPPIAGPFHILHFHTMSSPSDSQPTPPSYLYIAAKPLLDIPSRYRLLKPDQSFMTSGLRPIFVYEASPMNTSLNAEEQYTADAKIPSSDAEFERTCKFTSLCHPVGQSNTCFLQVGHKIVLLDDPFEVRVHADGRVFSWDSAQPYLRYIGTIPTNMRNDEKFKQIETETDKMADDDMQRSTTAVNESRIN